MKVKVIWDMSDQIRVLAPIMLTISEIDSFVGEAVTRMTTPDTGSDKSSEAKAFLFLTVILAPAASLIVVGGYGFTIWIYQLIAGPPGVS
jgi:nitrate reductase NapE